MRRSTTERVVTLAGVLTVVATIVLPLQPVFGGGGGARRDVVRFEKEQQHRQEALKLAKQAADHGKEGHIGALLTSAEAALQHAQKAGGDGHVDAGITELNQAIEHGQGGHTDVATQHAETARTHLSQDRRLR